MNDEHLPQPALGKGASTDLRQPELYRKLLETAPDALIVADGTSCRHQIEDGAQRSALHVARVLADHLLQPSQG